MITTLLYITRRLPYMLQLSVHPNKRIFYPNKSYPNIKLKIGNKARNVKALRYNSIRIQPFCQLQLLLMTEICREISTGWMQLNNAL